jgi:hypothetical protein
VLGVLAVDSTSISQITISWNGNAANAGLSIQVNLISQDSGTLATIILSADAGLRHAVMNFGAFSPGDGSNISVGFFPIGGSLNAPVTNIMATVQ